MPEIRDEPLVYRKMAGFKRALMAKEEAQMQEMARQWLSLERALEAQIENLAREFEARRLAGLPISAEMPWKIQRGRTLLAQMREESRKYADWAAERIKSGQQDFGEQAIRDAVEATRYADYAVPVRWPFDMLPVAAVEAMVGLTAEGSPLRDLLRDRVLTPDLVGGVAQILVQNTALGIHPVKTARAMAQHLTGGLQNALTIARTEQMRVYRKTSMDQYRTSKVVAFAKRMSAHDERVCPGCLALDGQKVPLGEELIDHPRGRCTAVPVVKGAPEPVWQSGEDWLKAQPEAVQASILGAGRFEVWKEGKIRLGEMVEVVRNEFGGSIRVKKMDPFMEDQGA